jgi:hypothetical protein
MQVSVANMKVRPAHAASGDLDQHLVGTGYRHQPTHGTKWLTRTIELHRYHPLNHCSPSDDPPCSRAWMPIIAQTREQIRAWRILHYRNAAPTMVSSRGAVAT